MDNDVLVEPGCTHEDAALLPWLVTGRLQRQEVERVEKHLQSCAACREDLARQRWLRDTVRADETVQYAPQAGLQKLMSRIDELEREVPGAPPEPVAAEAAPSRGGWTHAGRVPRWMAAAVVVQALGLGILGTALWHDSDRGESQPDFRTLTSAPAARAAGPRVRIVPSVDMTLMQFNGLLNEVHATVVDGPTNAGVYTLALPAAASAASASEESLKQLRNHSGILFAEPVVENSRP